MAQPFLISMEHSEWHARNVLKKFHKNRPLGKIHQHHKFYPPQPVLSCRTVDIDVTGTRTYRPCSNRDIIEEQHRLIHEIYSKARSSSSASADMRAQNMNKPESKARSLSALQIQGQCPGSRVSSRNSSKPESRPSSSRTSKKSGFIVLKVRPHTTESRKQRAIPLTESYLTLDSDPVLAETTDAFRSSSQLIKQTWEPENRALDQGKFVRGKDGPAVSTALDPKSGNQQWMSFGGGQKERSAGVVDAFTSTKEEKYFSIDGSTGALVAKQLQRGDKIRVGKNGEVRESGSSYQAWAEDKDSEEKSEEKPRAKPQILPLSWEEQVATMNARVIQSTVQKPRKHTINLCEMHPVVFKKFGEDGIKPPPVEEEKKASVKVKEGYNIQRRTADRIGIDGKSERPSAQVTHISVGKSNPTDIPDVKYEDVLDMKIKTKGAKGPHIHEEVARATKSLGRTSGTHNPEEQKRKLQSISKTSVLSEDSAREKQLRSSSMILNQQDTEAEINGLVLAPRASPVNPPIHSISARLENGPSAPAKRPTKSSGQSRPPPAKPVLHKSSAAAGSSISKNNPAEETEYIQISQQLCIAKETSSLVDPGKPRVKSAGSRQQSAAAIHSVTEHNKPTKDVTFKEEVEIADVKDLAQYAEEEDPNRYAFNIPTAEVEYPNSPDGHTAELSA